MSGDPGLFDAPPEGARVTRDLYDTWRLSADGCLVFNEIERRALAAAARGEKRVEVNRLTADVRAAYKLNVNNSFRSLMARELIQRNAVLKPLIETRRLRSKAL